MSFLFHPVYNFSYLIVSSIHSIHIFHFQRSTIFRSGTSPLRITLLLGSVLHHGRVHRVSFLTLDPLVRLTAATSSRISLISKSDIRYDELFSLMLPNQPTYWTIAMSALFMKSIPKIQLLRLNRLYPSAPKDAVPKKKWQHPTLFMPISCFVAAM